MLQAAIKQPCRCISNLPVNYHNRSLRALDLMHHQGALRGYDQIQNERQDTRPIFSGALRAACIGAALLAHDAFAQNGAVIA